MSRSGTPMPSAAILMKQYKELTDPRTGVPSFHITLRNDDIYQWSVGVMVLADDSPYNGGYFKSIINFPDDYPFSPPQFRFTPPIFHPNVYKDGRLCISILHRSGDTTSGEPDGETWSPVQTVESVLISIISLLSDPNLNSPANVDASVLYKNNAEEFKKRVAEEVEKSKANIPPGFVMPNSTAAYVAPSSNDKDDDVVDDDFWYDTPESEGDDDDEAASSDSDYDGDVDADGEEDELEQQDDEDNEERSLKKEAKAKLK